MLPTQNSFKKHFSLNDSRIIFVSRGTCGAYGESKLWYFTNRMFLFSFVQRFFFLQLLNGFLQFDYGKLNPHFEPTSSVSKEKA